jgi:hypothetical protein
MAPIPWVPGGYGKRVVLHVAKCRCLSYLGLQTSEHRQELEVMEPKVSWQRVSSARYRQVGCVQARTGAEFENPLSGGDLALQ